MNSSFILPARESNCQCLDGDTSTKANETTIRYGSRAWLGKVRFLSIAVIGAERSESPLSALHVSASREIVTCRHVLERLHAPSR